MAAAGRGGHGKVLHGKARSRQPFLTKKCLPRRPTRGDTPHVLRRPVEGVTHLALVISTLIMRQIAARRALSTSSASLSRLSTRGRALASSGGRAAHVWEEVNALAARPGMINMGQGFPDFEGSRVARAAATRARRLPRPHLVSLSPRRDARRATPRFVCRRRLCGRGAPGKRLEVRADGGR